MGSERFYLSEVPIAEAGSQKMKLIDLGPYFTSEPDEGQERWDRAPVELKLHFARAFAHAAGLTDQNPGEYTGPEPEQFEEED
jgi:hypothetical protein